MFHGYAMKDSVCDLGRRHNTWDGSGEVYMCLARLHNEGLQVMWSVSKTVLGSHLSKPASLPGSK